MVMSGWNRKTWGDIISLEYGKGIRGYADVKGPIRVFGTNGPVGWTASPIFDGPGIILGRKGAYRGVHYSPDPFFVIDTAYYVVPKTELDMRWLYYAIIYYKLGEIDDGSPIPSTTRAAVYVKDLLVPSPQEQRSIAQILSVLDDKIDLNRRMNETLEAMTRAIFKDWFVDFGPTRAKMEGRPPYLAPEIWELFPDSLGEDGLPSGWKEIPLEQVMTIHDSKRIPLSSPERAKRQGEYPYYGATSIMDYVDDYLFDGIHLLVGEDGSVVKPDGKPFTQYVWGKIWVNNHAHILQGNNISTEHLYCFFESIDIAPYINGAVQQKLNQANMKRIPFILAVQQINDAFGVALSSLFSIIRHNHDTSLQLAKTRDTLLPKLMTGEVRLNGKVT